MLQTLIEARERIAVGLAVAVVAWLLGRGIGWGVRRRYTRLARPSFANVMSRVSAIVLTILGLLAALTIIFPTVKPVNVLGSLGIFSIAIGFAFRDILENLLAGILLLFRAPFRTGDEVDIEGTRGAVQEINLRETVVRTYDGRRVLIPNSTVYKNAIVVQTAYSAVRTEAVVGVAYGTDLDTARQLALDTMREVEGVADQPPPAVLVGELAASTINLELLWWTGPEQAQVRRTRDRVLAAVVAAYDDAEIEMPTDIVLVDTTDRTRRALQQPQEQPDGS